MGRRDRPNGRRGAGAVPRGTAGRNLTFAECQVGCPIRRSADQSLFSAPRSLSQSTTSFIASCRQGIHQTPLLRLIRSRRRRTSLAIRSAASPFAKMRRPDGCPPPGSSAAGAPPRQERAPDVGQCHVDLGKTAFGGLPAFGLPENAMRPAADGRKTSKASSVSLSSRCQSPGSRRTRQRAKRICDACGAGGGGYRDRTGDPLLAKQMLSQLS